MRAQPVAQKIIIEIPHTKNLTVLIQIRIFFSFCSLEKKNAHRYGYISF